MKRKFMFLAIAAAGLASCNGGLKKGEGGMLYNIHTSKGNPHVKEGDFVALNIIVKTDGDSILSNSYETGRPIFMPMQKPQSKGDIMAGIQMLGEGDSATFKFPIDSVFKGGAQRPPNLKGKYLVFQVNIKKVIAKGNLTEQVFRGRVEDYAKTLTEAIKTQEPGKIKKYIADHNLKTTKTASGLNYVITTPGTGPVPAVGDTAVVNYTGRLTNGKIFETSVKEVAIKEKQPIEPGRQFAPIHIPVGQGKVIPGWDEGLQLMNKGSKAVLVIPSDIAYREQGVGPIGPFTPIVFEMEMVDIIKPNPNAPKPVQPPVTAPTR
ncbi:MAG TPA: FKBP-type peptidyl-prolyl cis-trans isomerase [Mucilaginibacter sp.]